MDRLDSHFFAGLLTHHKTKLEILGGVTQPEEWQSINIPSLERVVNVAQNTFDMVLLGYGLAEVRSRALVSCAWPA